MSCWAWRKRARLPTGAPVTTVTALPKEGFPTRLVDLQVRTISSPSRSPSRARRLAEREECVPATSTALVHRQSAMRSAFGSFWDLLPFYQLGKCNLPAFGADGMRLRLHCSGKVQPGLCWDVLIDTVVKQDFGRLHIWCVLDMEQFMHAQARYWQADSARVAGLWKGYAERNLSSLGISLGQSARFMKCICDAQIKAPKGQQSQGRESGGKATQAAETVQVNKKQLLHQEKRKEKDEKRVEKMQQKHLHHLRRLEEMKAVEQRKLESKDAAKAHEDKPQAKKKPTKSQVAQQQAIQRRQYASRLHAERAEQRAQREAAYRQHAPPPRLTAATEWSPIGPVLQ